MRFSVALLLAFVLALLARPVSAGPGDKEAYAGINAARGGFCTRAIPLLESAESQRHRPSSALALADCYAKRGDLVRASKLYHAIAEDKKDPAYGRRDLALIPVARKKAAKIDARIPMLVISPEEPYPGLEIEINKERVSDPSEPLLVNPRVLMTVVARAEGYEEHTERIKLKEKERRALKLRLKPKPVAKRPPAPEPRAESAPKPVKKPEPEPRKPELPPPRVKRSVPTTWLGVGYEGYVIPKFLFGIFGEAGRTVLVPGGDVSLTTKLGSFDLVAGVSYASFLLGSTPFKPHGHPDTDYEIIASDLQALQASVRFVRNIPLDERQTFSLRLGAGLGVGWTFLGDLYRTQAYPKDLVPGDPYTYRKCRGPNNPPGSFRYCNQLDFDADHYPGYVEPSWFEQPKGKPRGVRPLVYPWLLLPEIGLSLRPSDAFAIDLKVGASLSGFLTGIGVRFGL